MNNICDTFFTGHISALQEVDENEESNEFGQLKDEKTDDGTESSSSTSYHEKVLTYLFGKEVADSFLHPVMAGSGSLTGLTASIRAGKKFKSMSKKRLNLTYEQTLAKLTGNAERLWLMLRESSNYSIELEDGKMDRDLKSSFDAFARSCLSGSTTPMQRNFTYKSELNEVAALLNRGRVEKANLGRRKKQLMYMLSRVQQDNQALLMRDKSFLGSSDLQTGPKELLFPPIVPLEIGEVQDGQEKDDHQRIFNLKHKSIDNGTPESDVFDRPHRGEPRLVFFSEADSQRILKEKCEFRKHIHERLGNYNEMLEEKSLRPIEDGKRRKDLTSVKNAMTPLNSVKTTISDVSYDVNKERKEKVLNEDEWRPLTLGAVMDFKMTKKPTFINEDELHFRQGSVRLWRQKLTQA